jgi:phosphoribosylformylglycinamidine synthase PurS subunit
MPPYKCRIEIKPQDQYMNPASIDQTRRFRLQGYGEGYSDIDVSRIITFVLEASDIDTAKTQVDDMCQKFLVNYVFEQADISVTEVPPTPSQ